MNINCTVMCSSITLQQSKQIIIMKKNMNCVSEKDFHLYFKASSYTISIVFFTNGKAAPIAGAISPYCPKIILISRSLKNGEDVTFCFKLVKSVSVKYGCQKTTDNYVAVNHRVNISYGIGKFG